MTAQRVTPTERVIRKFGELLPDERTKVATALFGFVPVPAMLKEIQERYSISLISASDSFRMQADLIVAGCREIVDFDEKERGTK